MSKYDALASYLSSLPSHTREAALPFAEIEAMIQQPLPTSARTERTWWANTQYFTHARRWLSAGWKVSRVSLSGQEVAFVRLGEPESTRARHKASLTRETRQTRRRGRSTGYSGLLSFLERLPSGQEQVALTFAEVANLAGHELPPSALRERTWWSNSYAHPEFAPWVRAGWRVDSVYMTAQIVVFRRRGELPLKHIPRYVKYLLEGSEQVAHPDAETVARWLRFCRGVGWYFEGTVLYEKGRLAEDSLSETELVAVEEDYAMCKRELNRYKQ